MIDTRTRSPARANADVCLPLTQTTEWKGGLMGQRGNGGKKEHGDFEFALTLTEINALIQNLLVSLTNFQKQRVC